MTKLGARWDSPKQNEKTRKARDLGLLAYVEVTCPFAANAAPFELGLPMYAHCSENPVASAFGLNPKVSKQVREFADATGSPWIGEHLAILGEHREGALGYVLNPILTPEFKEVAVKNVRQLQRYYRRPVALELGPSYSPNGSYESEIHFLNDVAAESGAKLIVDVSHLVISNRNLGRADDFGLSVIDRSRVVELHIAGIRKGRNSDFWHDTHAEPLTEDLFELCGRALELFPNVEALTFEHSPNGGEALYLDSLRRLKELL